MLRNAAKGTITSDAMHRIKKNRMKKPSADEPYSIESPVIVMPKIEPPQATSSNSTNVPTNCRLLSDCRTSFTTMALQ